MTQRTTVSLTSQVEVLMTGSRYLGERNELGMQEYGVYTYPDGTRYTGEFLNGRFHGRGTIQIPDPAGIIYQVTHRHGKLKSIEQMNFSDQLPVDFEMTGRGSLNFESWPYCTAEDRRFFQETKAPLDPVGPNKFKTKDGPASVTLERNAFDLGFGIIGNRGFMLDTKTNCKKSSYLGCREARRWIRENCVHGPLWNRHHKQEVMARFAREIIKNNQESAAVCSRENFTPEIRVCRRSCSLDSFGSTRLHLASTSDTCSSEVQDMKMRLQDFRKKWRRSKSESSVCRIN
ncbi:uncharacterized protein LOC108087540 [Drosophila ficusphila]|uniref:uncharacterized protein LOC108087540 n=1 Tax=Drosophila ficusphila TaxID=30025 RepID=UPI0007E623F4|nr:uncharacterized protein LOC108087540 [Drosophila ficusphila]